MARVVHPIEQQSYEILRARVDTSALPPWTRAVVERVIHASADLGYLDDLVCAEADLAAGAQALRDGAPVVADSAMTAAGITAREAVCCIDDRRAAALTRVLGITRAAAGIRVAGGEVGPVTAPGADPGADPGDGSVAGVAAPLRRASSWIRLCVVRATPEERSASVSEVRKNAAPSTMVARVMKSVAPRPPNTVWAEPPKAPPASPPPFPDWSRTTPIRLMQISRCTIIRTPYMFASSPRFEGLLADPAQPRARGDRSGVEQ